ncbi:fic family toxin-antitoxin system, toxin component [Embleya sp. NBC_00896]|uniref:fic family toxin-antitoxin system, toxin component n=1 Tax=Embleya sp. NBC_00896 TaxID=2975961 RepID=UPI002F90FFC7|nr:fic family toxin-antitoxin system, toxin component [Embleya sp. NBC_00896]
MPRYVTLAELLELAEEIEDPTVTDFGALIAAVARHQGVVMGMEVYQGSRARAAALLHSLSRVPALEAHNATFAAAVAAYLDDQGVTVDPDPGKWAALAVDAAEGRADVVEIAARIRTLTT